MSSLLHNPVYNALLSGDASLNKGLNNVKYFDAAVSPFAAFDENNITGFEELYQQLPSGRKILFASPLPINQPKGWELLQAIPGLQFVFEVKDTYNTVHSIFTALKTEHINQMVALAALTRPGPFGTRTIEFGNYFGIFDNDKLVAMTGERLHVGEYTEISAVCTHPDYTGKGYANALLQHQLHLILAKKQIPFLHVKEDNHRAIALYQRLGFSVSRNMQFYFMKRQ